MKWKPDKPPLVSPAWAVAIGCAVCTMCGMLFWHDWGNIILSALWIVCATSVGWGLSIWVVRRAQPLEQYRIVLHEHSQRLEDELAARKLVEASLKKERSFFRQVIDINPNFIFAKDREGRFTLVNEAVAQAYGTTVGELLGKRDEDFNAHPDQVEHFRADDLRVMDKLEELFVPEEMITDSKGSVRYLQTVKRPIVDEGGRADQVLGVASDITLRKKIERELGEYREHLEQLVEQRSQQLLASQEQLRRSERLAVLGALSAGIAHEINNPVGAMMLVAENSLSQLDQIADAEEAKSLLERTCRKVMANAKRCATVVKGLLQFSHEQTSEKWESEINDVISGAAELVAESHDLKNVRIQYTLAPDLPPLVINPLAIEQVVVNLIKNALQSRDGGLEISVRSAAAEGGVHVEVSDNGCGICEADRLRMFDPFFTTRLNLGGTGLGLSLAHGIISEHNGTIAVESEPGKGTTIRCFLPRGQNEFTQDNAPT